MPGTFEKYPYTNFHGLNLDWILEKVKELDDKVNNDVMDWIRETVSQLIIQDTYDALTETLTIELVLPPTP